MNHATADAVYRQLGVTSALVISVTLVTLLFSFLGTILAAALVGMMIGCTRRWRWRFALVSLVFPASLLASMHFARGAVSLRDSLPLAAVCFAVFWGTCLIARGLVCLEARAPQSTRVAAAVDPGSELTAVGQAGARAVKLSGKAAMEPSLAELQGTWLREGFTPDGRPCKKVIQVVRQELALSMVDRTGKVRVLARGDLAVERLGAFKTVKLSPQTLDTSGFTAEELGLPGKWLYRISNDKLTLAQDFEESATGREPLVETFARCPVS